MSIFRECTERRARRGRINALSAALKRNKILLILHYKTIENEYVAVSVDIVMNGHK